MGCIIFFRVHARPFDSSGTSNPVRRPLATVQKNTGRALFQEAKIHFLRVVPSAPGRHPAHSRAGP